MKTISNRYPTVIVEYDCHGKRKQKRFVDPFLARRFYASKHRANKHPTVHKET